MIRFVRDPRARRKAGVVLAASVAAVVGACSASVGTEPAPLGTSVPLKVGQEYQPYPQGAVGISLASVDDDSRCPASVVCVWAGSAAITLGVRVGTGPTVPTKLTWGLPTGNSTTAGGVRIRFDSLTPTRATPGPLLPPERYTAWVTVFTP